MARHPLRAFRPNFERLEDRTTPASLPPQAGAGIAIAAAANADSQAAVHSPIFQPAVTAAVSLPGASGTGVATAAGNVNSHAGASPIF